MSAGDIDAINDYISRTTATTSAAREDQASWVGWYKGLGFFDKMSDSTLQDANAKRDRFNIDNKTPPIPSVPLTTEEAKYFLTMPVVDTTGMTAEQAQKAVWSAKPVSPQPVSLTVKRTTIKEGSTGDNVKEWQRIVGGIAIDGKFGTTTTAATKKWQTNHGLKADGIVGPLTWNAAYGDLPKLEPEIPSASTEASARSAEGPAVTGKIYATSTEVKNVTLPTTTAAKTTTAKSTTTTTTGTTTTDIKPAVVEAGFLSFLNNIPTWAKWALGLIAAGGIGYGLSKEKKQKNLEDRA
jgi:peptidoglycan hydrolase-like protein with peptidoglycan-binding domain